MSIQQSALYFLLTLVVALPVLAVEPSASDYPTSRSVLRRSPTVQIPQGDVDIVTAALAGADRKHNLVSNTKTSSRRTAKPGSDSVDLPEPVVEIPGLDPEPAPRMTSPQPAGKAPAGPSFLERWRQRRAETKVKAEARKEEKSVSKAPVVDGPILAPPEVDVPGMELPREPEKSTAAAPRRLFGPPTVRK